MRLECAGELTCCSEAACATVLRSICILLLTLEHSIPLDQPSAILQAFAKGDASDCPQGEHVHVPHSCLAKKQGANLFGGAVAWIADRHLHWKVT